MTIKSTGAAKSPKSITEPNRLGKAIRNLLLDDQEVEVAPLVGIAARA
jgi:hypothetical protein